VYNCGVSKRAGNGEEENMEIVDWEEEFSPPNEEKIEFYLSLCENLQIMAELENLSSEDKDTLSLSSHHLMVLLSMSLSGFHLYKEFRKLSELFSDDVKRFQEICSDLDVPQELLYSAALEQYENLIENG
jgi:hypothetical protein